MSANRAKFFLSFLMVQCSFHLLQSEGYTAHVKQVHVESHNSVSQEKLIDGNKLTEVIPNYSDSVNDFINQIFQYTEPCQSKKFLKDSLQARSNLPNFFVNASVGATMPLVQRSVSADLAKAFAGMKSKTLKDSMALVVNYVYVSYIFDEATTVVETNNIDSIETLLSQGKLTGLCFEQVNFLSLIISKLFPQWGYGIRLASSTSQDSLSSCGVSHVFLGLANKDGEVTAVLDPTVNCVWTDSISGRLLSLGECRKFLRNLSTAWRVRKFSSTFFGKYHSETSDSPYGLFSMQFSDFAGITAHAVSGEANRYIITGPWKNLDDENGLMKPAKDFCWRELNFPRMTWANNMLTIVNATCSDADIEQKFMKNLALDLDSEPLHSKNF